MQARREFPAGPLVLYAMTAALELPVILARYMAIYVVAAIAMRATGHSTTDAGEWAKLAVLPALWSVAALGKPAGGGWWWQQQLGGREPTEQEHLAYRAAMEELEADSTRLLPAPKRWFVLEESEPDAAVCGDTLMLTRGLLESPHLAAVLAHQLGHLQGIDARLTAALKRLVIGRAGERAGTKGEQQTTSPTPAPASKQSLTRWAIRMTIELLRGGLALRVTSIGWGQVWREQEYAADRFAASIGRGEELADFLQTQTLKHDHPIPLVWLTDHTHPPTALRIEALRALAKKQPPGSSNAPGGTLGLGTRGEEVRI